MPAPGVQHGLKRGFKEFFDSLVIATMIKLITNISPISPTWKAMVNTGYWVFVILSFIVLVSKMKYWPTGYTLGVTMAGIILIYSLQKVGLIESFMGPLDIGIYLIAGASFFRKLNNKFSTRRYYGRY